MAKDDISLGVEMGKLEIEPLKLKKNVQDENPFLYSSVPHKKNIFEKIRTPIPKCNCITQKIPKTMSVCKKKQKKILKEPVLKMLQDSSQSVKGKDDCCLFLRKKCSSSLIGNANNTDGINLCALVDNCNQLRISTGSNEQNLVTGLSNESQWWKSARKITKQTKATVATKSQAGSCSQEALNPPCDVTIDELASYFETLVHIPKKMSSMAEMMYI